MGEQRCLSHVYTQNPSLSQWGYSNERFLSLDGYDYFIFYAGSRSYLTLAIAVI